VAEAPGGKIGATIGATIYHSGLGVINTLACSIPPGMRFGDYTGAALNPGAHSVRIWAATEFGATAATNPCSWGTQIAAFTP
jgi:hypothetical protein